MIRSALAALVLAAFSPAALAVNGQISNLDFSVKFGSSPGLDTLDANGTYTLGAGNNGINLPSEAVVLSFDGGRFIQALPSNSFTAISGGWRYQAATGASGITLFKIMNNGTFEIDVRKADFTGAKGTAMGAFSFTIGDDSFVTVPNSVAVGKIVAPATGQVGSTITLDASQSTDFNSDVLSMTWSIVSQPFGSNVPLSSTNQATTSFIPTKNGTYVIRVIPHDGTVAGLEALATIQVTGGTDDPLPPPGPTNGLITIASDTLSYLVGEQAMLTVHDEVQPGGGESRYYYRATLDDAPIALSVLPGSHGDMAHQTAPFTEPGTHTFKVDLYIEDGALAKNLEQTITYYQNDVNAVNEALRWETDPDRIAALLAQKAADLERIAEAQGLLEENRTRIGETTILQFSVN